MKMTGSAPPPPAFMPDVLPAAAASTRATFAISRDAMHDATNHDLTSLCSFFDVIGRALYIVKPLKQSKHRWQQAGHSSLLVLLFWKEQQRCSRSPIHHSAVKPSHIKQ